MLTRNILNKYDIPPILEGFPGGLEGNCNVGVCCNVGDPGSIPGSGRSPGEGNGTTLVFLPGKSHGQRSLVVHGVAKSETRLSYFSLLPFQFLAAVSLIQRNESSLPSISIMLMLHNLLYIDILRFIVYVFH